MSKSVLCVCTVAYDASHFKPKQRVHGGSSNRKHTISRSQVATSDGHTVVTVARVLRM